MFEEDALGRFPVTTEAKIYLFCKQRVTENALHEPPLMDAGTWEHRNRGGYEVVVTMNRIQVALLMSTMSMISAQTRLDLGTQGKNVDFTAAARTKPIKTGTVLPASCTVGEMFFKTDAAPGSNVYGCSATNIWTLQSGGGSGGGSGSVTIMNGGVVVGTRATENFQAGVGLLNMISDTGSRIDISQAIDSAVVQTQGVAQAGTALFCASLSGSSSAYTCQVSPTVTSYTTGMVLQWRPDVNGAGGASTLNVDALGTKAVKLADGLTDPTSADVQAGRLYQLWYDGTVFRLLTPALVAGVASASRPSCSATHRGRIWQTFGGSGVKDELAVCAKDASGVYAWRQLY